MKKTYVLDTNVIITDPEFYDQFEDNDIVIPTIVIEELDGLKSSYDVGAQARRAIRNIEKMVTAGSDLRVGVKTAGGGTLRVYDWYAEPDFDTQYNKSKADNKILFLMYESQSMKNAILVTRDSNLRLKASSMGVKVQDFERATDLPRETEKSHFSSAREVNTSPAFVDEMYAKSSVDADAEQLEGYSVNEYVVVKSGAKSCLGRISKTGIKLVKEREVYGIKAKNKEQHFAVDALTDPNVNLVLLTGPAGSGKTILTLAAAFEQLGLGSTNKHYRKVIVTRPVIPVGKDIGFMPGTLEEKMLPWMGSIRDNLSQIVKKTDVAVNSKDGARSGNTKNNGPTAQPLTLDPYISIMIERGTIEIASIAHVRGRSITNAFVIVDESQNLSHHELKTLVTRCGEGTKIVLMGDLEQIDNIHVNEKSNGLLRAVERFTGHDICCHIHMSKGERSALATLASRIL